MADDVYAYDTVLYDRSFLNCYQRQAMVMLAERVPDLPQLFGPCLVSTDAVLKQVLRIGRPKYDFQSGLLAPGNLARLGIRRVYVPFATYAEARPALLRAVAQGGCAIPFIDVFYLPHTPEHRTDHVVHTVALTDHDPAAGEWSVLDDNRASVLCRYRYPEQVIADAYDNGRMRHVSWFTTAGYDPDEAARGAAAAFGELLDTFTDTHELLTGVGDLLSTPWISTPRVLALLYDAFALHEGSRTCLREFVVRQPDYAATAPALADIAARCKDLRNQLIIGKAIGRVDAARVSAACAELRTAEEGVLASLRAARPAGVAR